MKTNWKRQYFLAAVGSMTVGAAVGLQARADEPVECDTYESWVAKVGNQQATAQGTCLTQGACDTPEARDSWIPGPSTPIVTVRLKFHVFCETDGSNCASPRDGTGVAAQMAKLNSDFAPYHIWFVETTAAEFHNDSTYRRLSASQEADAAIKNAYAEDPAHQLNVYVVDLPSFSEWGCVGLFGRGTFPWDLDVLEKTGGILIDECVFGADFSTFTHEVGHCLGLWHTHHGVTEFYGQPCYDDFIACDCPCYERADGIDRDVTGDFASDTPPTYPGLCFDPSTCVPCDASTCNPCEFPSTCDPCDDPFTCDQCSVPCRPWAPQTANFMGSVSSQSCRTLFTPQQAGRMHCWIDHALTGRIACTTNEAPGSTCRDGLDNDCDGYADCEDVADCASDFVACRCYDNGGNSPLVCVDWTGAIPPEADTDFRVVVPDPDNPDVTFLTGNGGWRVWSQVSRTVAAPANLGDIKIDPTVATSNFSLTITHAASPGAASVKSIELVKQGWTGQSNLSAGSIAGNLGGLILQGTAGQSGEALFTIEGNVSGDINIPTVNTLQVKGAVSSGAMITLAARGKT
ncbi:MAG: hypothetical protein Q7R41_05120, partial [Phycisphaerales bacterium]|nr:hypothetical protein [Phycisphaerales bacterium]